MCVVTRGGEKFHPIQKYEKKNPSRPERGSGMGEKAVPRSYEERADARAFLRHLVSCVACNSFSDDVTVDPSLA